MRRMFFMVLWLLVNVASGQEPVVPEDCKGLGVPGGRAELACVVAKLQIQQQQADVATNELRQQAKVLTQQVQDLQKQRTQQADVAVKKLTQQVQDLEKLRMEKQQAEATIKELRQQVQDLEKKLKLTMRLPFEPEMVQITGGTFMMGSPEGVGESNEHPQHEVTVGDFAIGKYEVTQGEWQAVMGSNPSRFSSCGERCPVERVSWNDVQDYIAKLNAKTGKTYRLPTEAEWEYACRGGAVNDTYCGGNDIDSVAWYNGNSNSTTHAVGGKVANAWGLFDMSGNVYEWTCSEYDSNGYSGKEITCANKGNSVARAVCCGSWFSKPGSLRAAFRNSYTPSDRDFILGFRLVQD